MVSSPMRSPLQRSKSLTMIRNVTNNNDLIRTLPYCENLSPSEELVDTNHVQNLHKISSPCRRIMRLASIRQTSGNISSRSLNTYLSSKTISSTSCCSDESTEQKIDQCCDPRSPIRRRVSDLLKAGASISSRALFKNANNTLSSEFKTAHNPSRRFTEDFSNNSNNDPTLTTRSSPPRKILWSPSFRMMKKSNSSRDLSFEQTINELSSFGMTSSEGIQTVIISASPESNIPANANDKDYDDDDSLFNDVNSIVCVDNDNGDSSYGNDDMSIRRDDVFVGKRKQVPRFKNALRFKRQNSIGARMWNKIVTAVSSQRKLLGNQKRHVSFGMESDNEIIYILPYLKYNNVTKSDLWWTPNEIWQIRVNNRTLVRSAAWIPSGNDIPLTQLENDINNYNISFTNSYSKVLLNQQQLTEQEKEDLIAGLSMGLRGLEAFSPTFAHARNKMIKETVSSIVSLYKNVSSRLQKQEELEEQTRINASNLHRASGHGGEDLIATLHRSAKRAVANYQTSSNIIQCHSEALTAGCRMWAQTIGEAEAKHGC